MQPLTVRLEMVFEQVRKSCLDSGQMRLIDVG